MNLEQRTIAYAQQTQIQLERFLDELPAFIERHQKLVDKVQQLVKENERLSIQLQECKLASAKLSSRSRAKTVNGKSIE